MFDGAANEQGNPPHRSSLMMMMMVMRDVRRFFGVCGWIYYVRQLIGRHCLYLVGRSRSFFRLFLCLSHSPFAGTPFFVFGLIRPPTIHEFCVLFYTLYVRLEMTTSISVVLPFY